MPRKSRKNVGLIGLGIIGSRVAASLRACGYHVFVWNRTAKPAPNFLGSPAELAEICEVIQLFVADSQAVFEMIEALGDALTPRHLIVCSATIGPEATLEAARLVAQRGAQFLDAPFTGSRAAAERSQLVYYVGGDETVFLRAKPVLEASGKAIVRCGKIGDAATLKVVTNLISAVSIQVLAEALAVTRCAGIPPGGLHRGARTKCLPFRNDRVEAAENGERRLRSALLAQAHVQGCAAWHSPRQFPRPRGPGDHRDRGRDVRRSE